ncbi:MAG: restriction endonuclease subunit S [Candidatus Neomarinimicrobiota bacterium]|jgi:type I restriction enzyme S subunit
MKKYDNYKDSGIEWIGEIPEHWKISRIKFYLDYQKGKNPKELKFIETEETEVYLAMDYLRGNPKQMLYVEDVESYVKVDDNEILLLWDGSNAGEFVLSKKGILSSTMAVLNLKNIQKNFSWYYFKHFEPQLKESTIGMGVPHVNGEELKNGLIAIPTPEEQTAIASYLDRKTTEIDELIADKKRLLELYEEEKTAIINQAVTKGINPNAPMKDSGIEWLGDIPEHWEVKKVKHVLKSLNSVRIPLSADERGKMVVREYDYYGASGVIDKVENYLFDEPLLLIGEDGANLVTRNTRLSFIARGKYWVNNHAHILKPTFGILEYYCELMELCDYSIWISGSAQPKLTSENLMNIQIIVPPITEQEAIINHLEAECSFINAKKDKTNKLIDLLTEYRTALISEVVTGKIKVI